MFKYMQYNVFESVCMYMTPNYTCHIVVEYFCRYGDAVFGVSARARVCKNTCQKPVSKQSRARTHSRATTDQHTPEEKSKKNETNVPNTTAEFPINESSSSCRRRCSHAHAPVRSCGCVCIRECKRNDAWGRACSRDCKLACMRTRIIHTLRLQCITFAYGESWSQVKLNALGVCVSVFALCMHARECVCVHPVNGCCEKYT